MSQVFAMAAGSGPSGSGPVKLPLGAALELRTAIACSNLLKMCGIDDGPEPGKGEAMMGKDQRELLAAKFERHADEEGRILREYGVLGEKLGDSELGNLVSHILTEEELHHLLLRTMAKWLREPAGKGPALPPEATRAELLHLTRTLQHHEEETIDACSTLQEQLDKEGEDLIVTLLDAMVLDSEKHRRLLVVVEKMLQA